MRSISILVSIFFLIAILPAQNADSLQVSFQSDSSFSKDETPVDTLGENIGTSEDQKKITKEEYARIWTEFQLNGGFNHTGTLEKYYNFSNLININYTGMADVFRNHPSFQVYDFFSMGYPRFIAQNNLLPHQSDVYLNGQILNDPMHGMFNTHMISLDGLQDIDANTGIPMYGYGNGVNLKPKALNSPDEPYSRVMFRQGDFGYTDLDIDFSRKLSDDISFNAGGINKIYEGSNNYGFQYRAGLFYRITRNLYSRTALNIDREKIINSNFSEFPLYRYREYRHDVSHSFYYLTDTQDTCYWRLDAGYTRIRRKHDAQGENDFTFLNRKRTDQYKLGLERDLAIGNFNLDASVSAYQNRFWGSSFSGKLTDSGMNGSVQIYYPILNWLEFYGDLRTGYLNGQNLSWSPSVELKLNFENLWFRLKGSRSQRFPYRNERSLYFNQYRGNSDLDIESLDSYSATAGFNPFSNLFITAKIESNKVGNEIIFSDTSFYNGPDRKFNFAEINTRYSLYKFDLQLTGSFNDAGINISPKRSLSGQLHYHDTWLKGALIIDATCSFHWYDRHNAIHYNPIAERLYWTNDQMDRYEYFSYKLAATVKSAQLYMAMDNPTTESFQYVSGYYEFYRRVRFGVNWVLMD